MRIFINLGFQNLRDFIQLEGLNINNLCHYLNPKELRPFIC